MGDDFIAQIKDHYNRRLSKTLATHLDQPTLFRPSRKATISYPCRLNDALDAPHVGKRVVLRVIGENVEVLDEQRVIGFISPEATQDAIEDFKVNPDCGGVVEGRVSSVFDDSKRIDVDLGTDSEPNEE